MLSTIKIATLLFSTLPLIWGSHAERQIVDPAPHEMQSRELVESQQPSLTDLPNELIILIASFMQLDDRSYRSIKRFRKKHPLSVCKRFCDLLATEEAKKLLGYPELDRLVEQNNKADEEGYTLLGRAIEDGDIAAVNLLLENGADPNRETTQDDITSTLKYQPKVKPLDMRAVVGRKKIVDALKKYGGTGKKWRLSDYISYAFRPTIQCSHPIPMHE